MLWWKQTSEHSLQWWWESLVWLHIETRHFLAADMLRSDSLVFFDLLRPLDVDESKSSSQFCGKNVPAARTIDTFSLSFDGDDEKDKRRFRSLPLLLLLPHESFDALPSIWIFSGVVCMLGDFSWATFSMIGIGEPLPFFSSLKLVKIACGRAWVWACENARR